MSGTVNVTVQFAKDLKDVQWFGKMDPYAIIRCGNQTFKTRVCNDGGKDPVWDETFTLEVLNENELLIEVKDNEMGRDELIGTATVPLTKAREYGVDEAEVPLYGSNSKQQGLVGLRIAFQQGMGSGAPPYPGATPPAPAGYGYAGGVPPSGPGYGDAGGYAGAGDYGGGGYAPERVYEEGEEGEEHRRRHHHKHHEVVEERYE